MTTCLEKVLRARVGFDVCRRAVQRGDFCARHIQEDRCARAMRSPHTFADFRQCRRYPLKGSDFCKQHGGVA